MNLKKEQPALTIFRECNIEGQRVKVSEMTLTSYVFEVQRFKVIKSLVTNTCLRLY